MAKYVYSLVMVLDADTEQQAKNKIRQVSNSAASVYDSTIVRDIVVQHSRTLSLCECAAQFNCNTDCICK